MKQPPVAIRPRGDSPQQQDRTQDSLDFSLPSEAAASQLSSPRQSNNDSDAPRHTPDTDSVSDDDADSRSNVWPRSGLRMPSTARASTIAVPIKFGHTAASACFASSL